MRIETEPRIRLVSRGREYQADGRGVLEVPEELGRDLVKKHPDLFTEVRPVSSESEGGMEDGDN